MLIAEDLLLLLLDDESGAPQSSYLRPGLGGALLVELAMSEHVSVESRGRWRTAHVRVADGVPAPSDPVLADALATVAAKRRSAQDLVNRLGKDIQETLAERLSSAGSSSTGTAACWACSHGTAGPRGTPPTRSRYADRWRPHWWTARTPIRARLR